MHCILVLVEEKVKGKMEGDGKWKIGDGKWSFRTQRI